MFVSPLQAVLRRIYAIDTHHRFALDALPLVQTDPGRRLVTQLLRHYGRYLTGATDPDTRFCDFQNHVIHASDGYWGGAPRVAHQWYARMQRYMLCDRWSDAAHAAGVLSHYFTDPLQPLHTQHDQREMVLHHPVEWCVRQSYSAILRIWRRDELRVVFRLSDHPGWLGEAILHAARFANRKYERILAEFDLTAALESPSRALGADLMECFAELFGLATTGWARILERAASDTESRRRRAIPNAKLLRPMFTSLAGAPIRSIERALTMHQQRLEIAAICEEFLRTGSLQQHLPSEVDVVHRVIGVHEDEKRWKAQREKRLSSPHTWVDVRERSKASQSPRRDNPTADAPNTIPLSAVRNESSAARTPAREAGDRRRAA